MKKLGFWFLPLTLVDYLMFQKLEMDENEIGSKIMKEKVGNVRMISISVKIYKFTDKK